MTGACKVQYVFAQIVCVGGEGGGGGEGRGSKRGWSQQSFWRLRTQADFFFYDFFNGKVVVVTCECTQVFSLVQTHM